MNSNINDSPLTLLFKSAQHKWNNPSIFIGSFIKCKQDFRNDFVVYLDNYIYHVPDDSIWRPELNSIDVTDHFGQSRFSSSPKAFDIDTLYTYEGHRTNVDEVVNKPLEYFDIFYKYKVVDQYDFRPITVAVFCVQNELSDIEKENIINLHKNNYNNMDVEFHKG